LCDVMDVTEVPEEGGGAAFYSGAVAGVLCFRHGRVMSPVSPSFWNGSSWSWYGRYRGCRFGVRSRTQAASRPNPGRGSGVRRLHDGDLALLLKILGFVARTWASGCESGFVLDVADVRPPLSELPCESKGLPALCPTTLGCDRVSGFSEGQRECEVVVYCPIEGGLPVWENALRGTSHVHVGYGGSCVAAVLPWAFGFSLEGGVRVGCGHVVPHGTGCNSCRMIVCPSAGRGCWLALAAGCAAGCFGLSVWCSLCWLVGCLVVGCAVGLLSPRTLWLLAQGRNLWEWRYGCSFASLGASLGARVLGCVCAWFAGWLLAVWRVVGSVAVGCSAGLALGRLAGCVVVCVCVCVAWSSPPFTASASRGSARSSRPARGNEGGREGEDWGLDAGGREGGR